MSKSEDYLDQLLKGVNGTDDTALEEDFLEEDFLGEDLLSEDLLDESFMDDGVSEDFLKEFEMEMAGMDEADAEDADAAEEAAGDMSGLEALLGLDGGTGAFDSDTTEVDADTDSDLADLLGMDELSDAGDTTEEADFLEDLDSIVSGAKEQMEAVEEGLDIDAEAEDAAGVSDGDFSVEDFSYDDIGTSFDGMEETAADEPEPETPQIDDGEADVMKILEGLGDIDLGLDDDMGAAPAAQTEESKANDDALLSFLAGSAASGDAGVESGSSDIESFAFEENAEEADTDSKKKKKDKKKTAKKGEKKGFWGKVGTVLFGEDEEEEASTTKQTEQVAKTEEPEAKIEEFSDATLDLFKDFTTTPKEPVAETPAEPEDKKKKKKEKVKKEKVKKEKKPKPKKEKKPKKPKEPDNTPPLPKKPVFLIFLMVASVLALIIVGTDLIGYSNAMTNAKNAYAKQNYTEAYSYVSGMEIKEKDAELYEKYQIMAFVSSEMDAYEALMKGEFYDMALDCLLRTVGRCEKYEEDAKIYGCINELNAIELEAETILSETFNLSSEEALELYSYRDRHDYSKALNELLKELGMEKVTEE